jgi:integrase
MWNMLLRARAATGIQDLEFRRWRTTFATLYDADPRDLQAILGHSSFDMTMKRYKKPIAVRQQADVEELEARLSRRWSGCLRGRRQFELGWSLCPNTVHSSAQNKGF